MPSGQPTAPISRADLAQESLEDLRGGRDANASFRWVCCRRHPIAFFFA